MDESRSLEHDALPHRKPVQLAEHIQAIYDRHRHRIVMQRTDARFLCDSEFLLRCAQLAGGVYLSRCTLSVVYCHYGSTVVRVTLRGLQNPAEFITCAVYTD